MKLATWVIALCLCQAFTVVLSQDRDIKRVPYGTVFKFDGEVIVSVDRWSHTFEIRIPDRIPWIPIKDCRFSEDLNCSPESKITRELNNMRKLLHNELIQTIDTINELIPAKQGRGTRKRALMPFISEIGHSLFGIATDSQIDTLDILICWPNT